MLDAIKKNTLIPVKGLEKECCFSIAWNKRLSTYDKGKLIKFC
jgi:hypothetical protein